MKLNVIIAVLAILWVGMIMGIGMESIVKFNTPTLTKPVALDVGRTVFGAFNKAQIGLFILMAVVAMFAGLSRLDVTLMAVIALTVILQVVWLFPILSQHVDVVLAGNKPPANYYHALYGTLEIIKLIGLVLLGIKLL